MRTVYGNPSSAHQQGRSAKALVENARKNIAAALNITAKELVFTSGGTEANNLILINAIANLGVVRVVTSPIEHVAVLNPLKELATRYGIEICYVRTDVRGQVDFEDLRRLLAASDSKTLVSLMYVNNEIGTLLDVKKTALLCKEYKALFHSDAVQAVGHFALDLQVDSIDFIAASAHKFHGPKGVGFAYFKKGFAVKSILRGGGQEKGTRAGTEAVALIHGMQKALQCSLNTLPENLEKIKALKQYFIRELQGNFPSICFNGGSEDIEKSTATIVNVRFPFSKPMLLFQLDLKGISVSGGSACQSGSQMGSHVLNALLAPEEAEKTSVRFSLSKHTTEEELSWVIGVLKELL